ncbi:ATP-binding protein [Variovorax paradoxus]|uniref:ATP-binding protein n=1 Tax=Variovorax paradoxus TaxID=34073 RepID=UPI0009BD2FA7|nr:ATP-binding protein [Variovorax paradoxus]
MDTLSIDGSRPGVWVGSWEPSSLPREFESAVGLAIKLESWEELSPSTRNTVGRCTVFVLAAHTKWDFIAKIAFLTETDEPPLSDQPPYRRDSKTDWLPLTEFRIRHGQFVLSIGNRRLYEEVFRRLGPELAKRLLLSVNELVVLNDLRPNSRILRRVRTSPHDLWADFFREDEERFALVDFRRSMAAAEKDSTGLADVDWLEAEVPLWDGQFVLQLRLSFPSVLGQRQLLNVVIGPNGSGKTNLLLGLAKCAVNRRAKFGGVDMPLSAASFDDPYAQSPPLRVAVFTYERAMWSGLRRRGVDVYEQGVRSSDWRLLTELVYRIISSGSEQHGLSDLRLLREILSGFIDVRELWFPLHPGQPAAQRTSWMDIDQSETRVSLSQLAEASGGEFSDALSRLDRGVPPYMRSRDGREYSLSSGERSLVLFCTRLMTASRGGALVLVDEPENHLHPSFITLMIQTLARTMQATGSRALVVTHSPFVVREFEKSTVKVMKTTPDGVPEMFRPSLQTLGADVSMISDYVFEDEKIRKGFQASIDRAIRARQGRVDAQQLQGMAAGLGEDGVSYLIEMSGDESGKAFDA